MTLSDIPTAELRAELLRRPRPVAAHPCAVAALPIVKAAAAQYKLTPAEIYSKRRDNRRVWARWTVWLILSKQGWSDLQIGETFQRNRGTIAYGLIEGREAAKHVPLFARRLAECSSPMMTNDQ